MRHKLSQIQLKNNRTQVIEEAGKPVTYGLKRIDINNRLGCQHRYQCAGTNRTDCTNMWSTYRLDCTYCHPTEEPIDRINSVDRSIYLGCSGRSLHARLTGHIEDIRRGDKSNAMVKHYSAVHGDRDWRHEIPLRAR